MRARCVCAQVGPAVPRSGHSRGAAARAAHHRARQQQVRALRLRHCVHAASPRATLPVPCAEHVCVCVCVRRLCRQMPKREAERLAREIWAFKDEQDAAAAASSSCSGGASGGAGSGSGVRMSLADATAAFLERRFFAIPRLVTEVGTSAWRDDMASGASACQCPLHSRARPPTSRWPTRRSRTTSSWASTATTPTATCSCA